MKKSLVFLFFGLISIVMCDCISYKSTYPKSETDIVNNKCKSEAYLIQIFNLTNKDSLQVCIENKHIDLNTINHLDSMFFEGITHYYFNIAVWKKPFTKDYYVYSLSHDFNKYDIPKLFHRKNKYDDVDLCCTYKNRVYHCVLDNSMDKCILISVRHDTIAISSSNRISLLE